MAKTATYIIGCKLPAGIVIRHGDQSMKLSGANDSVLINGFGITRDVPAELWEGFSGTFADQPLLRNGVVFAVTDEASVKSAAQEREGQKTGLEQLDPKKQQTKPDKEE